METQAPIKEKILVFTEFVWCEDWKETYYAHEQSGIMFSLHYFTLQCNILDQISYFHYITN